MPADRRKRTWLLVLAIVALLVVTGINLRSGYTVAGPESPPSGLEVSAMAADDYSNETYHLVNYNPMSAYVNANPDFQYPTLSSGPGQPAGIYYVQNETDGTYPFVVQSLATDTVTVIANVVPLYQKYASYTAMIDNEFFLDYGYDVALFFGTTAPKGENYSIELVNLTTGQLYMWNTTSATAAGNQQAEYLGDDVVAVVSEGGTIEGYNLSSREQWNMYPEKLAFFEANNIYWVPPMHQLINVEAEGSTGDRIEVLGEGSGQEPIFTLEQTITWSSGNYPVNGVDGIAFNASYATGTPAVVFSAFEGADDAHLAFNILLPYISSTLAPTNLLTLASSNITSSCGGFENSGLAIQRYVFTSSYFICTVERNGTVPTSVWDPWNGSSVPTNLTPFDSGCFNLCFEGLYAPSLDYLLNFNATAKMAGGPKDPPYNVVYDYLNASQPYPVPPDLPTFLRVSAVTPTTIVLDWVNPSGNLVNDTVYVGAACGTYTSNRSLGGAGTSFTVTGLLPATTYCFAVTSWTTSGQSAFSAPVGGATIPEAPISLIVTAWTQTTATLSWTNPSGTLVNNTALWTTGGCGSYPHAESAKGVVTSIVLSGLTPGDTYCFVVQAWSIGGPSDVSLPANQTLFKVPDAPTALTGTLPATNSVTLTWSNPPGGGLVNNTIYEGPVCGSYPSSRSLGSAGTSYTYTGLASATSYCFAVSSWNATGQSPLSSGVYATTLPAAPSDLAVYAVTSTSISIGWSNPAGTVVNVTVFWTGPSCINYQEAATTGGAGTSFTLTGLSAGTAYCVAVEAWSTGGPSGLSQVISQRTLPLKGTATPLGPVWPPVFGWPNLNPLNWIGIAALVGGGASLLRYKRLVVAPALLGAGLVLLFLVAL